LEYFIAIPNKTAERPEAALTSSQLYLILKYFRNEDSQRRRFMKKKIRKEEEELSRDHNLMGVRQHTADGLLDEAPAPHAGLVKISKLSIKHHLRFYFRYHMSNCQKGHEIFPNHANVKSVLTLNHKIVFQV
jgi:hypothetical protein